MKVDGNMEVIMKYLIVDDEHELYKNMYADLFKTNNFHIEEIPRVTPPSFLKFLYKLHFNLKINRHIFLPFKNIWTKYYTLYSYNFNKDEEYCIIFLNGTLNLFFSVQKLKSLKDKYPNLHYVLIMYDSINTMSIKRPLNFIPIMDTIFSFDEQDCKKYNFERIYSTFSKPDFVYNDPIKKTNAFFVGYAAGRENLLKKCFKKMECIDHCKFFIVGIKGKQEKIKNVQYNQYIPYKEELQLAYNTNCIVEILREGQHGITLRTCEAIAFNKKLLTNNVDIKNMPFYDSRYMKIFSNIDSSDIEFIKRNIQVEYKNTDFFSPLQIIYRLEEIYVNDKI